ncbi:tail length tape measure protein [Vibrio phage D232]
MAGKSIKELVIKVKQQNAKRVAKDIEHISTALLEATEYAELFNSELSMMKVPPGLDKFVKTFDKMEASLEEIASQTRKTTNSIGAMRNEAIEMADNFQTSFQVISEGLDDIGTDAVRASGKVQKGFEGVEGAINETAGAMGKATAANKRLGNGLKDTNRQGTNQARTFSKMAQSAGGLASTYALVAANVFALSEGFRLLSEAAAVDRLEDVSTVISAGIGVSIAGTAQAMRDATDGAISYQAALRQAAASTAYGFDTQQIEEFTQVARRAAVVLGVEMTDALNRVIRGISKAEVELLDELGVTVRLNEAFARYAAQHNIAASSLNSFQRQQALANEVILKSEQNLGAADDALESTSWEQFGANVSSATNQLLRFISTSDSMLSVLNSFNSAFDEVVQLSRSDATFTPFTKTLEEAPDALSSIVAYNNLVKEQNRLIKEGGVARQKSAALVGQGIDGTASAQDFLTYDKETLRLNDQYNTLQAQLTGVRHELDLTDEALQKFADSMGITVDDVALVSDSIQNLSLLSRSLGSDLTSFDNQVRGKSTNPYTAMSTSIKEATRDIDLLISKNLSLDDALAKLKISRDQYNNFGDVQDYINLLDVQEQKMLDIQKVGAAMVEEQHGALYVAKQELMMLHSRNAASLAALDITELTVAQKTELFKAEQKVVKATERVQELNYSLLKQQSAIRIAEEAALNPQQTSLGIANDKLRIEQATYEMMLRQNELAKAAGNAPVYGTDQLDAQRDTATDADTGLTSQLNQTNFQMAQSALQTLNPEIASATNNIYSLADAWAIMGNASATSAQQAAASASAMGSTLGAMGNLVNAASGAVTSGIDAEIAAVEASGATQEEQEAQIKELNKKKIKEQEKFAKTSILISTAQGVAMALASAPWPINLVGAGMTAAAGALAYAQASNASSSQLAALESSSSSTPTSSLTVGGDMSLRSDVSQASTGAERSQSLGDQGVYGRASGGMGYAGNTYLAGENGKELITPKVDSTITPVSDGASSRGSQSQQTPVVFQIQALDAQSFMDRMPEIGPAMEEYYEQQGRKLASP